jgi:hypothetical protein
MPQYCFTFVGVDKRKITYPPTSSYQEMPLLTEDLSKQYGVEIELIPSHERIKLVNVGESLFVTVEGVTVNSWHWPPHDKKPKPTTKPNPTREVFRTIDERSGGNI